MKIMNYWFYKFGPNLLKISTMLDVKIIFSCLNTIIFTNNEQFSITVPKPMKFLETTFTDNPTLL